MRNKLSIGILLLSSTAYAGVCDSGTLKTIYNAQTGRSDYVCVGGGSSLYPATSTITTPGLTVTGSSLTINGVSFTFPSSGGSAGQCLITDGGNPPTLSFGSCSGAGLTRYIVLEDGITTPPAPEVINYAFLEDNSFFLLEGGTKLLLEH